MNSLIAIIILVVILVLTFCLVTLLLFLFQKHRKLVLKNFARDLNKYYKRVRITKIDIKDLPVSFDEVKEEVYFCSRAIIGKYDKSQRVINEKNWNINQELKNSKIKIFYHYKLINLGSSKFVLLNKIDLLITKNKLFLYDPLESEIITIKKIEDVTIFWEKNSLMQRKDFFPGIAFKFQKQSYFLLFETYNEILKFLSYLNLFT